MPRLGAGFFRNFARASITVRQVSFYAPGAIPTVPVTLPPRSWKRY
jgi:hypothetical protein